MKQTPFYALHQSLGAKFVDFGGWSLPVQFTGIAAEHAAVRSRAGLFDVVQHALANLTKHLFHKSHTLLKHVL